MKLKSILPGLLVLSVFTGLFSSCKLKSERSENYLIGVDSISVPAVITSKVQFEIKLYGIVGPNACYAFEKFYNYPSSEDEIILEVWGRFYTDGTPCTGQVVYLRDALEITIDEPGVYILKTLKPNGRYLEKQITVN